MKHFLPKGDAANPWLFPSRGKAGRLTPRRFSQLLEEAATVAGIDPAKETVVYGSKGNSFAYFALVTLKNFGAQKAYLYHGGIEDW